jgi:hypothetical protein
MNVVWYKMADKLYIWTLKQINNRTTWIWRLYNLHMIMGYILMSLFLHNLRQLLIKGACCCKMFVTKVLLKFDCGYFAMYWMVTNLEILQNTQVNVQADLNLFAWIEVLSNYQNSCKNMHNSILLVCL